MKRENLILSKEERNILLNLIRNEQNYIDSQMMLGDEYSYLKDDKMKLDFLESKLVSMFYFNDKED